MEETRARIGLARPEDAVRIARLIEDCYGRSYPYREFFDAAAVAKTLKQGSTVYAIAEDEDGSLLGQVALWRHGPHRLYEIGRAVVVPEHRSRGLLGTLGRLLLDEVAPRIGAEFVYGIAVTSHLFAQRFGRAMGMKSLGVLLGMVPESMVASEIPVPRQATSVLVHAKSIGRFPAPRRLGLVGEDLELAESILDELGVPVASGRTEREFAPLGLTTEHDENFETTTVRFSSGAPPRRLDDVFDTIERGSARAVWADVPVNHPAAPALLERLRDRGLGFGAYIPQAGLAGEDVLRMQRFLGGTLEGEDILVLDEDRRLLERVLDEAALANPVA